MNKADEIKILQQLRDPATIRQQAHRILALAQENKLRHFTLDPGQFAKTANFIVDVMEEQYPSFDIPYHSRWRHFEAAGIDRIKKLGIQLAPLPVEEQGKCLCELVILSVFLDAGAGKNWRYKERSTGLVLTRSEGLAVASLELYLSGLPSSDPQQPLRIDAEPLQAFNSQTLAKAFQLSPENPLEGVAGRVRLLNQLGEILKNHPDYFGHDSRLGNFYSYLLAQAPQKQMEATALFQAVLAAFNEVWPQRLQFAGQALGDVWTHEGLKTERPGSEFIPFHKLSQWLSYSLIEPLELNGIQVVNLDELTGLPEYRNGGLLIDTGLLRPKHEDLLQRAQDPGSEAVIEWRALTVALLDELARHIRQQHNMNAADLPLAKILQGGTWEAGRRIAKQKRPEGTPPIQIISDGTVF